LEQRSTVIQLLKGKYGLRFLVIGLTSLLLLILFVNPIARTMKIFAIIAIFAAANVAVKRVMRAFSGLPLEMELATLGSVMVTVLFGVKAGLLTAILCTFLAHHLSKGITLYTPMMASGYVLAALMALMVSPASIAAGGIFICVLVNIYFIVIFQLVGYSAMENFLYSLSNVALNALLFLKVAPLIVAILS